MRFAYADPPYPGKAHYYPERREVDHAELIRRLTIEYPDGWALSTSSVALAGVAALCPPGVRVLSWLKRPRGGVAWEPVIVCGGRRFSRRDGSRVPDALVYKGRYNAFPGAIVGMKPPQFSEWVFAHLGARVGDALDDLFPGSGAVSLAWRRYVAQDPRDVSRVHAEASGDASRRDLAATRRPDPRDVSRRRPQLEQKCRAAPAGGDASGRDASLVDVEALA